MASPRRRWRRWVFGLLLLVLVGGTIVLRVQRHGFEPPHAVRGLVMHVRNGFVDLYGARAGTRVILFDAGVDPEGNALDALLAAMQARRDDVSDIFLTHGHGDHRAAVPLCPRARVHAGAGDVDFISGKIGQPPTFARPMSWILPSPTFAVSDPLSARGEIAVGGAQPVVAIPFPGHTHGSYLFVYDGVLFTGDAILLSNGKLEPPPRLFSVDAAESRRSIAGLRATIAGLTVEVVCTGHGGCTAPADTASAIDRLLESVK